MEMKFFVTQIFIKQVIKHQCVRLSNLILNKKALNSHKINKILGMLDWTLTDHSLIPLQIMFMNLKILAKTKRMKEELTLNSNPMKWDLLIKVIRAAKKVKGKKSFKKNMHLKLRES